MRGKVVGLLGVWYAGLSIANVEFGAIAPVLIDGAKGHSLDLMQMMTPSCLDRDTIAEDLATMGGSYCLRPVGHWTAIDLLMVFVGMMLVLSQLELPQDKPWAMRMRKIGFVLGCVACSLAVLDRFSLFSSGDDFKGLSDLMPIQFSPWITQAIFAFIGYILMRGPKYLEAEAVTQTRTRVQSRREKATQFRSSFFDKGQQDQKVLERTKRSHLLRKDENLRMNKRRKSLLVMATCPYCKGAGCSKCNELGVF